MPQQCSICNHRQRKTIEKKISEGIPLRRIALQHNTSDTSLRRHRTNCVARKVTRYQDNVQIASLEDFIGKLEKNLLETEEILKEARDGYDDENADGKIIKVRKNPTVALRAVDSHNKTLSMYLDLFREARDAEDHELKVFRREQEDAMKIVMEEVSAYPELAERIAERLGGV